MENKNDDFKKNQSNLDNVLFNRNSPQKSIKDLNTHNSIQKNSPRKKPKRQKKILSGILLTILVLCLSILLAFGIIEFGKDFMGLGGNDKEIIIEIEKGQSTEDIIEKLFNENVIGNKHFFTHIF